MRPENVPIGEKPRSFIERARRAQIVACAIEAIADVGYGRASLARIAKGAGVSKGVISYHFAGKDDLLGEVVGEVFGAGARFMIPRIEAAPTAAGKLRAYLESNLEFIGHNRKEIAAIREIVTNVRTPAGRLRYDEAANEPMVQGVESILRLGQEAGDFRPFDTTVMARTIRAAIDTAAGHLAADPDLDPTPYGRELVALFDRATRKEAP